MNIVLEPKKAFQKSDDQTKAFRAAIDSDVFKEGVHKAIAQFVLYHKPSAEELEGVRQFMKTLLNMGEKEEPEVREPFMRSISTPKPQPKK
jgi:hypothetical protein